MPNPLSGGAPSRAPAPNAGRGRHRHHRGLGAAGAAREHAQVEETVGHQFRQDLSMAQIIEAAQNLPEPSTGTSEPQLTLW